MAAHRADSGWPLFATVDARALEALIAVAAVQQWIVRHRASQDG
jgi:hypothetical protein